MKFLFCFSTGIEKVIDILKKYMADINCQCIIDSVINEEQLNEIKCLSEYSAIVIQQYFTAEEPVNIDYLDKLSRQRIKNIVCIFEEEKRSLYTEDLYRRKLYNCFFGNDMKYITTEQLFKLMTDGRSKEEAQIYYGIQKKLSYNDYSDIINKISYITKKNYSNEELLINEIEAIISSMTDMDIKYILTELTENEINRLMCVPRFNNCYNYIAHKIYLSGKPTNLKTITNEKSSIQYRNIGVISSSSGAGSTFFTLNLACAFNSKYRISIIEHPLNEPYLYTYLGLNTNITSQFDHDNSRLFNDDYDIKIENKYYTHCSNKNISWILNDVFNEKASDLNSKKMLKLLLSGESNFNIVDIGQLLYNESILEIIDIFSLLIVVIDPMVPNLLNSISFFDRLRELEKKEELNVIFVVNKYCNGIDKKELQKFLYKSPAAYIPYVNPEAIYKSVYNCTIPYNHRAVKKELSKPLNKIINNFVLSNNQNKFYI